MPGNVGKTDRIARRGVRRALTVDIVNLAGRGLMWGAAVSVAAVGASRLAGDKNAWPWLVAAPPIAGLAAGLGIAWSRRWSSMGAARELDVRLGLKDRLSTAMALRGQTGPFSEWSMQEAEQAAAGVQLKRAVPLRAEWTWGVWPVVIAAALLGGVYLPAMNWSHSRSTTVAPVVERRTVQEQVAKVNDALRQTVSEAEAKPEQLRELEKLEQELAAGTIDAQKAREQAASKLADLARTMEDKSKVDEASAELMRDQLAKAAAQQSSPDKAPHESVFKEALKRGDLKAAGDAAKEAADQQDQMSETERRELARELDELAQAIEDAQREFGGDTAPKDQRESQTPPPEAGPKPPTNSPDHRPDPAAVEKQEQKAQEEHAKEESQKKANELTQSLRDAAREARGEKPSPPRDGEPGKQDQKPPGMPQGKQGATGRTGATGSSGQSGSSGDKQPAGPKSSTGASTGPTGSTGEQGPSGNSGATGVRSPGATGSTGSSGKQGQPGATGENREGPTGATGPAGVSGSTGEQASRGATGATGKPPNQPGATGSTPQAQSGATGAPEKPRGPTGTTSGHSGPQGAVEKPQGATGPTPKPLERSGATGTSEQPQGSTGAPEQPAATGVSEKPQGPTGSTPKPSEQSGANDQKPDHQGATGQSPGPRGQTGPTGPSGSSPGATGPSSSAAPTGVKPDTGVVPGATGVSGRTGGKGPSGATGPGGDRGATGESKPSREAGDGLPRSDAPEYGGPSSLERVARQLHDLDQQPQKSQQAKEQARKAEEMARQILEKQTPEQRQRLEQMARDYARKNPPGRGAGPGDQPAARTQREPTAPRSADTNTVDTRPNKLDQKKQERVMAEWYSDKPVERNGQPSLVPMAEEMQKAADAADRAVEQQTVPARYGGLIKRVFKRYAEQSPGAQETPKN